MRLTSNVVFGDQSLDLIQDLHIVLARLIEERCVAVNLIDI